MGALSSRLEMVAGHLEVFDELADRVGALEQWVVEREGPEHDDRRHSGTHTYSTHGPCADKTLPSLSSVRSNQPLPPTLEARLGCLSRDVSDIQARLHTTEMSFCDVRNDVLEQEALREDFEERLSELEQEVANRRLRELSKQVASFESQREPMVRGSLAPVAEEDLGIQPGLDGGSSRRDLAWPSVPCEESRSTSASGAGERGDWGSREGSARGRVAEAYGAVCRERSPSDDSDDLSEASLAGAGCEASLLSVYISREEGGYPPGDNDRNEQFEHFVEEEPRLSSIESA